MEIWKLCAAALLATVVFCFARFWNPSFDIALKLSSAVFFLGAILYAARPLVETLVSMTEGSAMAEHAGVLLSAIGIAILTQTVSEICRDCKEGTVAGYVELAGRIEILLLCLPLLAEIHDVVEDLLI